MTLNFPTLPSITLFSFFIMSRDVILSLLAKGSNGEQILQILDSICDGVSDGGDSNSAANPTLSEVQF